MESMTASVVEGKGAIFAALAKARAKFKPVVKSATNPHFRSKYATLEDYIGATVLGLSEFGLAVIQRCELDDSGRLTLRTLLVHAAGEYDAGCWPVIPVQNTPQGLGSALAYARRYSYASALNLAAEDDDGNDSSKGRGAEEPSEAPNEDINDQDTRVPRPARTSGPKPSGLADRIVSFARSRGIPSAKAAEVLKSLGFASSKDVPEDKARAVFEALEAAAPKREPGSDDDDPFGKLHEDAMPENVGPQR